MLGRSLLGGGGRREEDGGHALYVGLSRFSKRPHLHYVGHARAQVAHVVEVGVIADFAGHDALVEADARVLAHAARVLPAATPDKKISEVSGLVYWY